MAYNYDGQAETGFARHYANGSSFRYGPGRWRVFARWLPNPGGTVQGGVGMIPYIYCHGGFVTNPFKSRNGGGYLPFADETEPGITGVEITETLNVSQQNAGRPLICLITMEFSPGFMGAPNLAYPTFHFQPTQSFEMYWLCQYLAQHYDDPEIWGNGNSIDPDKFIVSGFSQGAQNASIASLLPQGYVPSGGENQAFWGGGYSRHHWFGVHPSIRAAWVNEPFIDQSMSSSPSSGSDGTDDDRGLSQANLQTWIPGDQDGGGRYTYNGGASESVTSHIPRPFLKMISPYWWAKLGLRRPATVCDSGTDTLMTNLYYSPDGTPFGHNATFTPGVPNVKMTNTHNPGPGNSEDIDESLGGQAYGWHVLMREQGFISDFDSLSESWFPNGPTTDVGDPSATSATVAHRDWMQSKVLPNLT